MEMERKRKKYKNLREFAGLELCERLTNLSQIKTKCGGYSVDYAFYTFTGPAAGAEVYSICGRYRQ